MKKHLQTPLLFLLGFLLPLQFALAGDPFIRNEGQVISSTNTARPDIRYYASSKKSSIFLREAAISYVFSSKSSSPIVNSNGPVKEIIDTSGIQGYRIDMELVGADPNAGIHEVSQLSQSYNFYLAHCPNGITNVPSFEKIIYEEVYAGIDLVCYWVDNDFKYDFIVHPGADPSQIKLRFYGGEPTIIDGKLMVISEYGTIEHHAPATYTQYPDGAKSEVENRYRIDDDGNVFFDLDNYDTDLDLVIDPLTILWSVTYTSNTFFLDKGLGIVNDGTNLILLTSVGTLQFPATVGQLQNAGSDDYAIINRDLNGNINWATYFGGSSIECVYSKHPDWFSRIKLDSNGNIIITGTTSSSDLPVTNITQNPPSGAFLAKFNTFGLLQWARYHGNVLLGNHTTIRGLTIHNDEIFVAGYYLSNVNPVNLTFTPTSSAYSQTWQASKSDAFIAKFSGSGEILWGTLFGGPDQEDGNSNFNVVINAKNEILLAGGTLSNNLPGVGANSFSATLNPLHQHQYVPDLFIAKFNGSNFSLIDATYIGGSGDEILMGLEINPDGEMFLTGYTTGTDLPGIQPTSFQSSVNGLSDIFIMKVNQSCNKYKIDWSTYYGGSRADIPNVIKIINNRLYVIGYTESSNFPTTSNTIKLPQHDIADKFILTFEPNSGQRIAGVCDGTIFNDWANDITNIGNQLFVIGISNHRNNQFAGDTDITLSAYSDTPDLQVKLTANTNKEVCSNNFGYATLTTIMLHGTATSYSWTRNGTIISGATGATYLATQAGKYCVMVSNGTNQASDCFEITIYPSPIVTVAHIFSQNCTPTVEATIVNFQANHTYKACVSDGQNYNTCITVTSNATFALPVPAPGNYTLTVTDEQSCLGCSTVIPFTAAGAFAGAQVLGSYGQVTVIDATTRGGVFDFDGTYHVMGPLELINGTFNFNPGTIFYVNHDGGIDPATMGVYNFQPYHTLVDLSTGTSSPSAYYPTIIKVNNATLNLIGAKLSAACGGTDKWGGINVTGNSVINSQRGYLLVNGQLQKIKSEISHARVAIGSARINPSNPSQRLHDLSRYSIIQTDFLNNIYGVWTVKKELPALSSEGIQNCWFKDNAYAVYIDGTDTSDPPIGGYFGGEYSAAVYTYNTFENNYAGIYSQANNIKINHSQFTGNTTFGILATVPDASIPARAYVEDNTIQVPANGMGIHAHNFNYITRNTISGTVTTATGSLSTVGIGTSGPEINIYGGNTFSNLDVGVRGMNSNYVGSTNYIVVKNFFTNNATGFYMSSNLYSASQSPVIRCNDFSAANVTGTTGNPTRGIHLGSQTYLNELGSSGTPNGNAFGTLTNKVQYDGTDPFTYWKYNSPSEALPQFLPSGTSPSYGLSDFGTANPLNACGGSSPGVNQRVTGTSYAAILEMMDSLRLQVGSFADMKYYQQQIIAYYEQQNQLASLEQYVQTLPGQNQEAFNTLGLYLMEQYRKQGLEPMAQNMKDFLLMYSPNDAEVYCRTKYFDMTGRWYSTQPPLGVLSVRDSLELTYIANSGTTLWEQACFTLRFYYPNAGCTGPANATARQAAVKVAGTKATGKATTLAAELGQSYPNPTAATATIPYRLPKGTVKATIVLHDVVTGRKVKSFELPIGETEGNLSVELGGLSNGLYAYSLLVDGKPVATKKLAVMK